MKQLKKPDLYPAVLPGIFEEVKSVCQIFRSPADPPGLPFLWHHWAGSWQLGAEDGAGGGGGGRCLCITGDSGKASPLMELLHLLLHWSLQMPHESAAEPEWASLGPATHLLSCSQRVSCWEVGGATWLAQELSDLGATPGLEQGSQWSSINPSRHLGDLQELFCLPSAIIPEYLHRNTYYIIHCFSFLLCYSYGIILIFKIIETIIILSMNFNSG